MKNVLEEELFDMIVDVCDVEMAAEEEVAWDAPLIGPDSPMMLDSLDAVEIIVAIQTKYNIRISNQKMARKILKTIRTLADFVQNEINDDPSSQAAAS